MPGVLKGEINGLCVGSVMAASLHMLATTGVDWNCSFLKSRWNLA